MAVQQQQEEEKMRLEQQRRESLPKWGQQPPAQIAPLSLKEIQAAELKSRLERDDLDSMASRLKQSVISKSSANPIFKRPTGEKKKKQKQVAIFLKLQQFESGY